MLLSKLVQSLGALSLAQLALAAEEPKYKRTNESVQNCDGGGCGSEAEGHSPNKLCFHWCYKTETHTVTETAT